MTACWKMLVGYNFTGERGRVGAVGGGGCVSTHPL